MMKPYPKIDFSGAEQFREWELRKIGRAFAKEMEELGNPYALKGGTAMRFLLDVPRPSMDLDFEGERRIWVRRHVKRALRTAFPNTRYSVACDFMRTGEIGITPPKDHKSSGLRLSVDYRDSAFEDVPTRIPLENCTRYDGIVIYKPDELVHRKLQTMVGPNARYKPRDIYDAGMGGNDPSGTRQRRRREEAQELDRVKNAEADTGHKDCPGRRSDNGAGRHKRTVGVRRTRHRRTRHTIRPERPTALTAREPAAGTETGQRRSAHGGRTRPRRPVPLNRAPAATPHLPRTTAQHRRKPQRERNATMLEGTKTTLMYFKAQGPGTTVRRGARRRSRQGLQLPRLAAADALRRRQERPPARGDPRRPVGDHAARNRSPARTRTGPGPHHRRRCASAHGSGCATSLRRHRRARQALRPRPRHGEHHREPQQRADGTQRPPSALAGAATASATRDDRRDMDHPYSYLSTRRPPKRGRALMQCCTSSSYQAEALGPILIDCGKVPCFWSAKIVERDSPVWAMTSLRRITRLAMHTSL